LLPLLIKREEVDIYEVNLTGGTKFIEYIRDDELPRFRSSPGEFSGYGVLR